MIVFIVTAMLGLLPMVIAHYLFGITELGGYAAGLFCGLMIAEGTRRWREPRQKRSNDRETGQPRPPTTGGSSKGTE